MQAQPELTHWSPRELRKLPRDQRRPILEEAAKRAEAEYRNDPELTACDAFGKEDLHSDSANTETR